MTRLFEMLAEMVGICRGEQPSLPLDHRDGEPAERSEKITGFDETRIASLLSKTGEARRLYTEEVRARRALRNRKRTRGLTALAASLLLLVGLYLAVAERQSTIEHKTLSISSERTRSQGTAVPLRKSTDEVILQITLIDYPPPPFR